MILMEFLFAPGHDFEFRIVVERESGDVVVDADGEDRLGRGFREFVEHRLDHRGGEFLRAEAITSADDADGMRVLEQAHGFRLAQSANDIEVERFAE